MAERIELVCKATDDKEKRDKLREEIEELACENERLRKGLLKLQALVTKLSGIILEQVKEALA